jgi:hypothetical protein
MKLHVTAAAFVLLTACSGDAPADAQPVTDDGSAAAVMVASLADSRTAAVEDQLIECVEEKGSITLRQFFVIRDGGVLSYSQMQNAARPMCEEGQPDCGLGWQGEDIGLYFRTASGALNQMRVDLDSMTMTKRLTTDSRGTEDSTASCTSAPIPADITYL